MAFMWPMLPRRQNQRGGAPNTAASASETIYSASFLRSNEERLRKTDNADLSLNGTDSALSFHVYLDNVNSTYIISKVNFTSADGEYLFYFDGSKFLWRVIDSTSTNGDVYSATGITSGQWYHVVVQHEDGVEVRIQVDNGTVFTTAHTGGCRDGTQHFHLGGRTPVSTSLSGRIALPSLWKRLLTSDEVGSLYNSGNGLPLSEYSAALNTSLIAHWKLNELEGSSRADSVGANTLTEQSKDATGVPRGNGPPD